MEELPDAIAQLAQTIAKSNTEQKISLLPQALKYGELGIDFLIECLEDPELEIRAKAYELLQNIESQKAQQAIAPGLLLNPGDRIYSVYQSETWFTDDGYCLNDNVKYLDEIGILVYGNEYFYDHEEGEFRKSKRLFCYLSQEEAEQKAEEVHRKLIQNEGTGGLGFDWGWREQDPTIEQWCRDNLVDRQQDFGYWQNRSNLLDYLHLPENIKLLSQFWKDGVGHFAFVEEEYIQQKVYLRIEEKLTKRTPEENIATELIARPKDHKQQSFKFLVNAWESDLRQLYLLSEFVNYGKLGIDFLIDCLRDKELEVRTKVYELLRSVELKKARDAIAPGLLLNPGDKIYSVYQAGICYTDRFLQVLWNYVDYPEQLRYQLEEDERRDRVEQSQRVYFYTNKQQAEVAAEALHRRLIKETKINFEWRKENPDFNPKQWCIDNNFSYKSEWDNLSDYQIVWVIKDIIWMDDELSDNFRRNRCIYHPKHIDTWCDDNQIKYNCNLDNEKNYRKLIDYLDLPENIELLSKFWKDGIGQMAFVKEEIVQQTAYVKIGKKLNKELGEDKIFAVPKEFEVEAAKLLVEIIDSKNSERETRTKARKMLQENDWDEIPFWFYRT